MNTLTYDEMVRVKGGAVNWGMVCGFGAAISFIIGVIDGWINPGKCNS